MTFRLPLTFWPMFLRPAPTETPRAIGQPPPGALRTDIGLPDVDSVPADAMALAATLRDRGYML